MSHGKGKFKARIMDATAIHRALSRIAHEILEHNPRVEEFALIAIRRRGVPLANRLAQIIKSMEGVPVKTGILDITLYRDDLTTIADSPVLNKTDIPFDISGKTMILVDDVLYTGRTFLTALQTLYQIGHPEAIRAAVLIDRGHRQLPLHADYIGKTVPTASNEIVRVELKEIDHEDQVILSEID